MYEISTQEWMTVIYQAYDVCKQQYENSHSHWKIDNKFHITIDDCLQRISKDCCEIDFTGLGPRGTDDGNIRVDLISVMNEARVILLDYCMNSELPKLKKLYLQRLDWQKKQLNNVDYLFDRYLRIQQSIATMQAELQDLKSVAY